MWERGCDQGNLAAPDLFMGVLLGKGGLRASPSGGWAGPAGGRYSTS